MGLQGKKILVDAGHGGSSVGAVGTLNGQTIYEKSLTLMYANSLRGYLEYDGATVVMTRTTDTYVDTDARWQLGSNENVDAVISIHFNGGSTTARGTETFYALTRPQDLTFTQTVHNGIFQYMGTQNRGVKDDTKTAVGSLAILRYPTSLSYPRCLIEVEFITNPAAMAALDYPLYESSLYFAAGVLTGLRNFFA